MKNRIAFVLILFFFSVQIQAQDFSTYTSRKVAFINSLKDMELNERGKHGLPRAIARLNHNPNDTLALSYITNILDHEIQSMFDFPGVALALCRYWDSFSPAQIAEIKSDLERLAKPDKIAGEGFLGHGTENHATVMWCSAYLFGQLFPDAGWANGMSSKELMADMKERLRKTFKNVYQKGYTEYLSTTYEVVMNFPVEILLEYAKDQEVKDIAEAFMLYKWSIMSLNNFEGNILAPYARMNTQEDHAPAENYIAATTYYNWLMWGWGAATGNVRLSNFKEYQETTYALYAALSGVVPDDLFFRLADSGTGPFSLKSSASAFGTYGTGIPHMMMRNVFRDKSFAIGTGNFRWFPGGHYADHDNNAFSMVWHSPDRFNYIGCFHPYWYSDGDDKDRTPDTWYKGNISPFQQTAHHQNTVITLFNIPEKDPWLNTLKIQEWALKWAWRDGHADGLIKRGMLRYPKSVDEKVEANGWIFLREGETYIGIKPLKDFYTQNDLVGRGLDGFTIVKSDHAQTGFIFEVGTKEEFGSFEKFQKKLPQNKLTIDWAKMTISYTNSKGTELRIQYNAGLPVDPDGLARSVPSVWINGKMDIPFDQWPTVESPWVNMHKGILNIQEGNTKILVDWKGEYPIINRRNLNQSKGDTSPDIRFEYPVKISKNQRYFTDARNRPFFYQACTGWMLLSKLTREETEVYLKNRSEKGFNTIQVTLLPWKVEEVNCYGEPAFLNNNYFTQPNEKYFEHVDWVLQKANEYGIQLSINVFWLRNNWREHTSVDNARVFGNYVASRFLNHPNIMWYIGGDINPDGYLNQQKALAETIHSIDNKHLLSSHCGRYSDGTSSSSSMLYHREPWHDFNMAYCYDPSHSPRLDPYAPVQFIHAYNLKPVKPVILGESFYEEIKYSFKDATENLRAIRMSPLWGLTSGITGHAVGHGKIFPFTNGWQKAMDDPNSLMVRNLTKLTNEIKWWTLVPDMGQEVAVNGYGNFGGAHYISLAFDPKGKLAVAYFPHRGKLTVDLSKFAGQVKGKWFDPVNGNVIPVASILQNKGTYVFSPPGLNGGGAEDFLLILESN